LCDDTTKRGARTGHQPREKPNHSIQSFPQYMRNPILHHPEAWPQQPPSRPLIPHASRFSRSIVCAARSGRPPRETKQKKRKEGKELRGDCVKSVSHHRHSPPIALNEGDSTGGKLPIRELLCRKIIHLQSLTLRKECWQHTTVAKFEVEVVAGSVTF
jgi:hypothetical protein